MLPALGQRDVERRARRLGVGEEHLVEVAHPVEEERIGVLRLDRPVLGHHRRDVGVVVQGLLRADRFPSSGSDAEFQAPAARYMLAPCGRFFSSRASFSALAGPAAAEPIAGQDDPRFEAALAAWLADDEPAALPELAALAAEGNRAAQVLLALIDRVPAYQGPWLVQPQPQGAAGAHPRSRAASPGGAGWRRPRPTPRSPRSGSSATGRTPTVETALAFAGDGRGPRRPRDTAGAGGAAVPRLRGRRRRSALPAGPPAPRLARVGRRRRRAGRGPRPRSRRCRPATRRSAASTTGRSPRPSTDAWLATAPLAAPLRATCDAVCPASPVTCRRAAFLLVERTRRCSPSSARPPRR